MAATAARSEPLESPRNIVREAIDRVVERANGVLLEASPLLEEEMRKDADLYRAIMDSYLPKACWEAIRRYAHAERLHLWAAPNSDTQGRGERIHHLAQANMDHLFNFRLPIQGLPKLGVATYAQVEEAMNFYFLRAADMRKKGTFLKSILGMLKNKRKTVGEQLKLADLQVAYDSAHVED